MSAPVTRLPPSVLGKRLTAISVQKRMPDLMKKSGADPTGFGAWVWMRHIEEAIGRAEADMFVTYVRPKGSEEMRIGPSLHAAIHVFDGGHFPSHLDADVTSGGLAQYGLTTSFGYAPGDTGYLLSVDAQQGELPSQTTVLIWLVEIVEEERVAVHFVTLDGDSYGMVLVSGGPTFELRVAPPEKWPNPVPNPAVGRKGVASGGLAPVDEAFAKCAEHAWATAQKSFTPKQRQERQPLTGAVVRKACENEILAWEKKLAELFVQRVEKGTVLYDKARARLTVLQR